MTPLDFFVLATIAKFYCMCRPQLSTVCFPGHADSRALRNRLNKLRRSELINRTRSLIPYRGGSAGCPVWYLTRKGLELLSEYYDDESYLALSSKSPRESLLFHWLAIGDTHIAIDAAMEHHKGIVSMPSWVNEWEVVNKDTAREDRFYLHTVFQENPNPLSCSPDAGFVLNYCGQQIVYYLEQDRNTSGAKQIGASKCRGYAELASRKGHRRHFPETTFDHFRVLMITTHRGRRNALAREIKEQERSDLWLFVCQDELTPETFPFGNVFYDCNGVRGPLLRKQEPEQDEEAA